MSRTTLYAAKEDGELASLADFRNGWHSGPHIWDALCRLHNTYDDHPQVIALARMMGKPVQECIGSVMLQDPERLTKLLDDPRLDAQHRLAMLTTWDGAYVAHEHAGAVAQALKLFPNATENLIGQGDRILSALNEGYRYFAWNQTSVSESFWWIRGREDDDDAEDDGHMFNLLTDKVNSAGKEPFAIEPRK